MHTPIAAHKKEAAPNSAVYILKYSVDSGQKYNGHYILAHVQHSQIAT